MTSGSNASAAAAASTTRVVTQPRVYAGRVCYLYAFDVGYDLNRELRLTTLLGQPVETFQFDTDKRIPKEILFHRPQMVRLAAVEMDTPAGRVPVGRQIKLFGVGAISVMFEVPVRVERLEDLVPYHQLHGAEGSINDAARKLVEQVLAEQPALVVRPVPQLRYEEAYTVFCLEPPVGEDGALFDADAWLQQNRRRVAALLTEEDDPQHLSVPEAEDTTSRYLSYYSYDLVVVDWDAALVWEKPENVDELLHIVELANVQLCELEAYDRVLDAALQRAYRDVSQQGIRARGRKRVMRDIRELRVDVARLTDEISNITKFFGDWHLARVYQNLAARFHLTDWQKTIDNKLDTLDDLYRLLQSEVSNRMMLVLEAMIVLLFVIDIVMLLWGTPH